MRGLWLLSWRHLTHERARTAILVVCIAVAVFLPVTVELLIRHYNGALAARAAATPLVAGAKGNRFDLTLAALYFRQSELETIPFSEVQELADSGLGTAIPMHVRFAARRYPVVGTSPEYFELRRLRAVRGTLPQRLGDVVIGATVSESLRLATGDTLFSDPTDLYDISRPPVLKMRVSGVLPPTNAPEDTAVFVDVKTCWILEGIAHGHDDASRIEEVNVLARSGTFVNVSPAVRSYQEVTDANVDSFHYHGDAAALPLSAIILVPKDAKTRTVAKARINGSKLWQMVVPAVVIDDLMRFVFRIKALLDGFALVLALTTALMLGLQLLLSMRLREREMNTLHRIGCSPRAVGVLYATEILMVLALSLLLAGVAVGATQVLLPDLVRAL